MASQEKEKGTKQELLPSFPDDLSMSCFACVSRLYHPTLSLVSKSFASLLASRELYKTRSLLGCISMFAFSRLLNVVGSLLKGLVRTLHPKNQMGTF
ncbi:unnamed protein product [Brassica rapa subsp. trilocularis]